MTIMEENRRAASLGTPGFKSPPKEGEVNMFRLALPQDAPEIVQLYRPYVENTTVTFEYETPTKQEMARRIDQLAGRLPWILAFHEGKLLGYAYAHPYAERAAYQWSVETSIYMAQHARHLGVGRRLYGALFELLQCQGLRCAVAIVTSPNPASDAFHQALGFEKVGFLPNIGYKQEKWLAVSLWQKAIAPGEKTPPAKVRPLCELCPETVQKILQEYA